VTRYDEVDAFVERAMPFLEEREAENNLILGLSSQLRHDPQLYGEDPYLAVVEDGQDVRGVVFRTPPHNLILSELDDERAIAPIVAAVHEQFASLPGVVGPKERVAQFAAAWQAAKGARGRLELAQRIFRVDRVEAPEGVPGSMRAYEPSDRELASRWMDAFAAEALPANAPHPESSEEFVDRRERDPDGGLVCWEDGEPVSFAGYGGLTPNGIRIGPVHAAGVARPWVRECAHRRVDPAAPGRWPALLLPLHRPREPDVEPHLPTDRLPRRRRLRRLDVLELGRGDDRDPAARLLAERHAYLLGRQLECLGHVAADLDRERFAEGAFVPEAVQVQLQRLRLEAERPRGVLDRGDVQVWLARDRADRDELVARQLDVRDAWVQEALEPGEVLGAGVTEGDELARARFHAAYCTPP
jgi:uncharacterized protein